MSRINKTAVGTIEVISLTDGQSELGNDMFPNADDAEIAALLARAHEKSIMCDYNAFLVKTGDQTVLIDAGPRETFGPTCGFLAEALAEAETDPADVTRLFLTHLHPDHITGAITKEGKAVFPNAQVLVPEADHKFWTDASTVTDETSKQWHQLAVAVLNAYAGRVELINGDAAIAAGVTMVPLPGHTPGHAGFRVDDGKHSLVQLGDIVHAQSLQIPNPDISVIFDLDADQARATRKRALDMVATDGVLFSGGHISRPTLMQLDRSNGGYRLEEPK